MTTSIQLTSIAKGAEFAIQLAAFPESEPVFAYVDDIDCTIEPLRGLEIAGKITIHDQAPFMWLQGARECMLFKPTAVGKQEGVISFRSLGVGEFCVEIYYVQADGSVEAIYRNDFCFK